MLEFRILGPFEVVEGDRPLSLGGPKQRALLAVLVLHRGEAVSTDRLIDELWGEQAPATAAKTVQVYVSNLRKVLGDGLLVTRGHGYSIAPESGQVDLDRFEELAALGRDALERGDTRQARERLREALALWRGSPLADFAYETFAQAEISRLEEARLAAVEDEFDAELAVGDTAASVPRLEALVREHPLRERLHGQLMLALYRSGRQADALERYRQVRRRLIDELGIEPGPELKRMEQAILIQDPALRAGDRPLRPRAPRRVGALLALGGVLLVAAAAGAMLELLGGGGSAALAGATSDSVALISGASGTLEASFPVGGNPASLAVGAGAVWALNADDETVTRIDLRSHGERTFGTGGIPVDLAAGDGSLWVVNGTRTRASAVFPAAMSVSRLDPATDLPLATIALPPGTAAEPPSSYQIAVGARGVWVIDADGSVSRIDPATNRIVQTVHDASVYAITTGAEGTWAIENTAAGSIAELRPGSERVARHVAVPAAALTSIAVGAGSVWVTDPEEGELWRIDPGRVPVERTISLGQGASDVSYGDGSVWVSNQFTGTVSRIDPRTNRVTETVPVGNTPGRLAVGDGVWVAVAGTTGVSVPAAAQAQSGVAAVPASVCGPVISGGNGNPQRLMVSDLPLHGGADIPALQMSAAIAYVLREHRFRAGRFRLGYQSCDDSTSQSGIFDPRKCVSNAHAWVDHPLVIGVIGPYNSSCAVPEISITNQGGRLAMVSPTNTLAGLTHADPLAPPGFLNQLYPTGARNYVRVYPNDDLEAAAMAEFARRQKLSRVFVLYDSIGTYGQNLAYRFQQAAGRFGLRVTGSAAWNPPQRSYAPIAARVAASGATAAYLGGGTDPDTAALIRALRHRLGARFAILAPESLIPIRPMFQLTGGALRGVYIAIGEVPNGPLPAAGRQFLARFAATQRGAPVNLGALYAAQATEVLLDAIARSDGTRRSVTRSLFATCQPHGLLGSFCFDANGDPTVAPVTILQVERPGNSATELDTSGTKVVAVIDPRHTPGGAG